MLTEIQGLHHVTSLGSGPAANNAFFTQGLGLRRVKTTVNFDKPEVYHLYYGDDLGRAGTVMTYFPFPNAKRGKRGVGEVGVTFFAVPHGALAFWADRLPEIGATVGEQVVEFGQKRLYFKGIDGDDFALIEIEGDTRAPYAARDIPQEVALRGFAGVRLVVRDAGPETEILRFMGYRQTASEGGVTQFVRDGGNGADWIEIAEDLNAQDAKQGAGSVHHVAFSVANSEAHLRVREAFIGLGHNVTEVKDRNYFKAIYFRTPGGILFEVATDDPGFAVDEDAAHLGEALKLPQQHAHLREHLEQTLQPLEA